MIFVINNTYTIWVPIPMLNKALYTSYKYPYVLSVDMVTFIITGFLIFRAIFIISGSHHFHLNLRIILLCQLCSWFEIVLARYLMFPYMIGRKFLGDTTKIYHHYWTNDVSEMVPIPSFVEEWPLFVGGFLYSHQSANCIFFIFAVSAERAIASYYLSDYETTTRLHIPILITLASFLFSCAYSIIFAFNFFTFLSTALLIIVITISSVILYSFVYNYNMSIKTHFHRNSTMQDYSLAKRFQTLENLKSLTMAKYVVTSYAVYVTLCQTCLICVYSGVETKYWDTFIYVMDSVVYYGNMFITLFVIFSVDSWKNAFLKTFCVIRNIRKRAKITEECNPVEDAEKISSEHFRHLDKMWND